MNDELPDDIEDDEKYVAIPDKRELGLGKPMVLDFAREFLPNDFDEVERYIFSKGGAYRKFRAPANGTRRVSRAGSANTLKSGSRPSDCAGNRPG